MLEDSFVVCEPSPEDQDVFCVDLLAEGGDVFRQGVENGGNDVGHGFPVVDQAHHLTFGKNRTLAAHGELLVRRSGDFRTILPRFTKKALKANQALIDLLTRVAEQKQATPAQIALAWVLAQKPWIVPIPGTTRLSRLEENLKAADIELSDEELREMDQAAAEINVMGARYPEEIEKMTGR